MIQKHLLSISLALAMLFLLIATFFYPGGSQADAHTPGYDWANNYLCNLFDAHGINGAENKGRIWAFIGMFFLCLGFGLFFYRMSLKITHKSSALIIRYAGMAAMFFAFWVITPYHDLMVTTAVTMAMIALFYLTVFILMSRLQWLKLFSILTLLFLYFDAFVYYSGMWRSILPVIQKANYLMLIVWILWADYLTSREDFVIRKKAKN